MSFTKRSGVTIVELMVVIAIVTILVSLTMPAVQSAREAARKTSCRNKVRQCGLALANFESSHRQFPSNGWGWAWVADASIGRHLDGPGGWISSVLPHLEQSNLFEMTHTPQGRLEAIQTPIDVLVCPSRRAAGAYPYTQIGVPLRNCEMPALGSRSDYAICSGDRVIPALPGPETVDDLDNFHPLPASFYSGIAFVRSAIRVSDISDGLSNTLAVAEKLVPVAAYTTGRSLGDDQTALIGNDSDIRRWTQFLPLRDATVDDLERFGSAHATGIMGVMCDG